MWIARDKNGELYAYLNKPEKFDKVFGEIDSISEDKTVVYMRLPDTEFIDVNFENSPQEVKCVPSMLDKLKNYTDHATPEELKKKGEEINAKINSNKSPKPEFVPNIDWEEVRVNAAIQFMAALLSSDFMQECGTHIRDQHFFSKKAVDYADELIEKLKKNEE